MEDKPQTCATKRSLTLDTGDSTAHEKADSALSSPPAGVEGASTRLRCLERAEILHGAYIEALIEAGDFCPWARGARLAGRARIHALFVDELADFVRALPEDPELEVWQLVVPDATESPMGWRDQVASLERDLRRGGVNLPWAFAAFHPTHPGRPESIGGAIGLLRRSPLPALQLVHLDVLQRVRRHSEELVETLALLNRQRLLEPDDVSLAETHARLLAEGRELRAEYGWSV